MRGAIENMLESHADWWALAGYDAAVGDVAADWLAAPTPLPAPQTETKQIPAAEARTARAVPARLVQPVSARPEPENAADMLAKMPGALAAFCEWLPHSPAAKWGGVVIGPTGQAGADLMIISEFPEAEDETTAMLHSDQAGRLLDAMLAAVGLDRARCYLASLAVTRPPGGRITDADRSILDAMMLHHIGLVGPKRLLLLGNRMSRLFGAADVIDAQSRLLEINQNGVNMEAVAIYHPRFLLGRPHYKAISWTSLKRLRRKI